MNQDVKQEWLDALRSDKYEQGEGFLQKDGRYCCLGVLCDLAEKAGVIYPVEPDPDHDPGAVAYVSDPRFVSDARQGVGEKHILPDAVVEWADLDSVNPFVEVSAQTAQDYDMTYATRNGLAAYNDHGMTFREIADLIEAQL